MGGKNSEVHLPIVWMPVFATITSIHLKPDVSSASWTREIVIRRRNNNLQFIADTHRLYDALQYPLMFWKRKDGYCTNINQRDPVTGTSFITNLIFTHLTINLIY